MNKNSAKSHIGAHVNLHMRDGSVIVNVRLLDVRDAKATFKSKLGKGCAKVTEIVRMDDIPPIF